MRAVCGWTAAAAVSVATLSAAASRPDAAAQAQQEPANLRLAGQVVDDRTGRPVAGAAVTIAGGPALPDPPTAIADGAGRFTFIRLRPAKFTLTATAQGYLTGGDHSSDGMAPAEWPADLTNGASRTDMVIRLVKPASLSGYVMDDAGAPVEDLSLVAFREVWVAGQRRLAVAGDASSDDRGWYRIDRLAPGDYVVCTLAQRITLPRSWQARFERASSASPAERVAFEEAFSRSVIDLGFGANSAFVVGDSLLRSGSLSMGPFVTGDGKAWSAPDACNGNTAGPSNAPRVTLAGGDDRAGIDMRVELQPASRVSGQVFGPEGPLAWQGLKLEPDGFDALGWADGVPAASTISDASGAFTFLGIPPGKYSLKAFSIPQPPRGAPVAGLPEGDTLSALQTIVVGTESVDDLAVKLVRGPRMSGRLVFDGTSPPPSEVELGKAGFNVLFADGSSFRYSRARYRAVVSADASFRSTGLVPGRYVVDVAPIGPWQLESAMFNGIDISDQPFEAGDDDIANVVITMTDQVSSLSGTVRDEKGVAVAGSRVIVFPTDRTRWIGQGERPRRQRQAATSPTGVYSLRGLPAGDYFVAALGPADTSAWQTPEAFAKISATAQKITLAARETRTLDLKAGGR